jgi:hypothetical protein
MAFLVQQILDEPNVPRNFALGHKGTNSLESVCKDSNIQSRILSEGFEEKLESFQKDSKKSWNPSKRIRRKVRILPKGFKNTFESFSIYFKRPYYPITSHLQS